MMWEAARKHVVSLVVLTTTFIAGLAGFLSNYEEIKPYFIEEYVPASINIRDVDPTFVDENVVYVYTEYDEETGTERLFPLSKFVVVVDKIGAGTVKNCVGELHTGDIVHLSAGTFYTSNSEYERLEFAIDENTKSIEIALSFQFEGKRVEKTIPYNLRVACEGVFSNKVPIQFSWEYAPI
jgi:hypothetical protein